MKTLKKYQMMDKMYIKKYKIDNENAQSIIKFLNDNQAELWVEIVKTIQYCLDNNLDKMEAFIIEPSTERYFVYKSDFKETLDRALVIFEKYEKYEICAEVVKIKNRLK